jgi:hypothetical protein
LVTAVCWRIKPHLPTELPPEHDTLVAASRPTTLPQQATDHAADQAQPHLPTELPPEHDAFDFASLESRTLPSQALDNAAAQAQEHLLTELPAVQSHELSLLGIRFAS